MTKPETRQKAPSKRPTGRPSLYTHETGVKIARLHAQGKTWKAVCAEVGVNVETLMDWVEGKTKAAEVDGFPLLLARARKFSAAEHAMAPGELLKDVDPDHKYGRTRLAKAESLAKWHQWLAERMDRDAWGDRNVVADAVTAAVTLFAGLSGARPTIQATAEVKPTDTLPE